MITSRIDYCNALIYGTSDKNLVKLKRLQNVAAKIIVGGSKYEHVRPISRELHCLTGQLMTLDPSICRNLSICTDRGGHCALSLPGCLLDQERDQGLDMPLNLRLIEDICSFKTALKAHYFTKHYGD